VDRWGASPAARRAGVAVIVLALAFGFLPTAGAHPLVAALTVDDLTPYVDEIVHFDASATTGDVAAYRFFFGDGTQTDWQKSPFAEHAYAEPGIRIATVLVSDRRGRLDTASVQLEVRPPPPDLVPIAATAEPAEPRVGDEMRLAIALMNVGESAALGAAISVADIPPSGEKTFVDTRGMEQPVEPGATVVVFTGAFVLDEAGRHTIRIVVFDVVPAERETGNNALDLGVEVGPAPPPVASLIVDDTSPFRGQWVTFDASSSEGGIVAYRFDFGDGHGTDWQESPTARHAYGEAGQVMASVTVRDAWDATDRASVELLVRSTPPPTGDAPDLAPAAARIDPPEPRVDDPIRLAIAIVNRGGSAASTASIDVFDVGPSGSANLVANLGLAEPLDAGGATVLLATFRAVEEGAHTLQIVVYGVVPSEDFTSDNLLEVPFVVAPALVSRPLASLTVDDTRPFVGEVVRFNASASEGRVVAYRFDFGDGNGTDWQEAPVADHAYRQPGPKTAHVVVRDERGLESSALVTLVVRPWPPTTGPAPDLAPVAAAAEPAAPRVGDTVTLAIAIANHGGATALAGAIDVIDMGPRGEELVREVVALPEPLAPGSTTIILTKPFQASVEGAHRIRVIVRDVVPFEEFTENNIREVPLEVEPAPSVVPAGGISTPLVVLIIALATGAALVAILLLRPRPEAPAPLEPPSHVPPDRSPPPLWPLA